MATSVMPPSVNICVGFSAASGPTVIAVPFTERSNLPQASALSEGSLKGKTGSGLQKLDC